MAIDETTRKRWEKEDKGKEPSKHELLILLEVWLLGCKHDTEIVYENCRKCPSRTACKRASKQIRKLIKQSSDSKDWTPTAENINALSEPIRQYIHDIETNCDPAGMVRENTILKDTIQQLQLKQQE